MTTEAEWAWVAGLFEGEGCIDVPKSQALFALVVQMTDEDVIRRLQTTAGSGVVSVRRPPPGSTWHPIWRWRVGVEDAERILHHIMPYLGQRRHCESEAGLGWSWPLQGRGRQPADLTGALDRASTRGNGLQGRSGC